MAFEVRPLHSLFAAELIGGDIAAPVTPELHALVESAMAEFAVLVVRGQAHARDEDHIRFSRAFGPLELPPNLGLGGDTRVRRFAAELYDASNLDEHGEIDRPDTLRRRFAKGNENFHTDSSFNALPTKWSLLLGHIVTPERGQTEFVDTRAAYERLPDALRRRVDGLEVEHSLTRSRERGGLTGVDAFARAYPPVRHPLVRVSASGRPALYIGAHASHIVGMDVAEGRALLDDLVARATVPDMIYAHTWRAGDLLIWDNRCTMHRATAFDYMHHKRDLRRTTINEGGPERCGSVAEEDRPAVAAA